MADGRAAVVWEGTDLVLAVHAQPGARRTEAAGMHGAAVKVRIAARAVDGAANAALIEFLAAAFGVAKRGVQLISGDTSRQKCVRIVGPDRAPAEAVLRSWGVSSS